VTAPLTTARGSTLRDRGTARGEIDGSDTRTGACRRISAADARVALAFTTESVFAAYSPVGRAGQDRVGATGRWIARIRRTVDAAAVRGIVEHEAAFPAIWRVDLGVWERTCGVVLRCRAGVSECP